MRYFNINKLNLCVPMDDNYCGMQCFLLACKCQDKHRGKNLVVCQLGKLVFYRADSVLLLLSALMGGKRP